MSRKAIYTFIFQILILLNLLSPEVNASCSDDVGAVGINAPTKGLLVRQHRGSLNQSMKTVVEIEPTIEALSKWISESMGEHIDPAKIHVEPYGFGSDEPAFDTRIGWTTFTVSIDGFGLFGFSNGPIPPPTVSK
ncbi:MAG: hypothetical protein JWQ35_1065 [Bacteriovoracaceae bacterium]|nr:hypothetical protein [Bacteriovoracaceae bacterium]